LFRIGISSSTLPQYSSFELKQFIDANNLERVDLRMNKNHNWEKDDWSIFKEDNIAFLGTDIILGDYNWSIYRIKEYLFNFKNKPVRVFASNNLYKDKEFLRQQIMTLKKLCGSSQRILVETHDGYCTPNEIFKLSVEFHTRVLLDNLGLAMITSDFYRDVELLQPFVLCIHIKGFNQKDPANSLHLPIKESNYKSIESLLNMFSRKPITVLLESKNNSFEEDLRFLLKYKNESMRCAK